MIDSFDSNTDRNRERCFQRIRDTTRARTTGSEARTQRNPPFYYDWPARRLFLARVLNHHHPTILKHDFRFYYVVHVCVCLFIYRSVLYSMNCGHPIGSNKTKQRNLEPRTKYVCETARRVTTQDTRIPNRYHDTTQHQQKRTNERTNERTNDERISGKLQAGLQQRHQQGPAHGGPEQGRRRQRERRDPGHRAVEPGERQRRRRRPHGVLPQLV